MTARVLTGKEVTARLRKELFSRVEELKSRGISPKLAIVLAGDASPSKAYIKGVEKACSATGVAVNVEYFPPEVSMDTLQKHLEKLNKNPQVHGILVMQPLPEGLEAKRLQELIRPEKDVDSFNPINGGRVMAGDKLAFPPCTPQAVMEILDHYEIPLQGRRAVVIGRSMVVGRPQAMLLLDRHATVTICHSRTTDMEAVCREADILVAAAGRPALVKAEMVKPGAVVLDVGINFVDNKMVGDVDYTPVAEVAGAISPVPGGVGSVTSTVLMKHCVEAAEMASGGD
jgi:methylenetetrahydrofolate dehydrogenase (NADP+)/methenyltetrahydrofolate cyclohydrolase